LALVVSLIVGPTWMLISQVTETGALNVMPMAVH
jgi:hypothetical protein